MLKTSLTAILLTVSLGISANATNNKAERGCTVLMDHATSKIIHQQGADCNARYAPQSSFKFPLALMGYEAGVLIDDDEPEWNFEEGFVVNKPDDKQRTDPEEWQERSVVWYSQKITTLMGKDKFADYVNRLNYGNKNISGDKGKNNGLTNSWLMSSLKISALEQLTFVNNFVGRKYSFSPNSYEQTEDILPEFDAGEWDVYGKTGSGWQVGKNGQADKSRPMGWFVGWAEDDGRIIIFAKLVLLNGAEQSPAGPKARDALLAELPVLIK